MKNEFNEKKKCHAFFYFARIFCNLLFSNDKSADKKRSLKYRFVQTTPCNVQNSLQSKNPLIWND